MMQSRRSMRRAALAAAALCLMGAGHAPAADAADLYMFESRACVACRMFNAEIAPDYEQTAFGRAYPLRRVDMQTGSIDFTLAQPVNMTPTFVFVEGDAEIARFVGYPGRKYFYEVMEATIARAEPPPAEKPVVNETQKQAMN